MTIATTMHTSKADADAIAATQVQYWGDSAGFAFWSSNLLMGRLYQKADYSCT
jgi:hypothetical protein